MKMPTNKKRNHHELYPSVPLIGNLIEKLTPKLSALLNEELYNRLTPALVKISHYLLLIAAVTGFFIGIMGTIKLGYSEYLLLGLGFLVILPSIQYISNKFIQSNLLLLKSTPSQISSILVPNLLGILSLVCSIVFAAIFINEAITLDHYMRLFYGLFALLVGWSISIYARKIDSLYITVDPSTSAGGEALGILSLIIRISYRIVPLVFSLLVIYGVIIIFIDLVTMFTTVNFDGVAEIIRDDAIQLMVFTTLPIVAYLCFSLSYLIIDILRSILSVRKDT